jgi:hypothetical protein
VPDHRLAALHRARQLLAAERALHVSFEPALNHAANHVTWLIVGMDYYYATLHFVVVIGLLLWLYLRHPQVFAVPAPLCTRPRRWPWSASTPTLSPLRAC